MNNPSEDDFICSPVELFEQVMKKKDPKKTTLIARVNVKNKITEQKIPFDSREEIMIKTLEKYFRNKSAGDIMVKILTGKYSKPKISLRILDWFVTNYSKKNNIVYNIASDTNPNVKVPFNVYLNYKSQLKAFKKKNFDPFCRRKRIDFTYNSQKRPLVTTVAQLNFFKWSISNQIVSYVSKNFDHIFEDMNITNKKQRIEAKKYQKTIELDSESSDQSVKSEEKKKGDLEIKKTRKPRQELSISATKKVNKYNVSVRIKFI